MSGLARCGLLAALALGVGCAASAETFRGTTYEEPAAAEDFVLSDQHGNPFRLSEHRGKVILLFFGYAMCPDVCPVTLSTWAKVREQLSDRADDVEFVFVTVDPERDTLERLAEHLAVFDESFIGLGGSTEDLDSVYEAYEVYRNKVSFSTSAVGYVMDHTSNMFVIDREGRLRLSFPFDSRADDVITDIRQLLDAP